MKMQNILRVAKNLAFILLFFGLVVGCEEDDNSIPVEGTNSIVNHLEKDSSFTLFSKAVKRAGLYGMLNGNSGTYTVLAPNDSAMMNYLDAHNFTDIDAIPLDRLKRLVKYHILETLTPADNFVTSYVQTLAEIPVNDSVSTHLSLFVFSTIDSVTFNGEAHFLQKDISVDNGILDEIDHTLALPTLKTFLTVDDNLRPFYNKITAPGISTDFESLLSDPDGKTTILVPDKNAVNYFFEGPGSALSPQQLNQLYRYHLLDTLSLTQNLATGYVKTKAVESYSGHQYPLSLYVNTDAGLILNEGTSIGISDLATINGNIQVIDSVLTLPSVATFVKSDARYEDFAAQLTRDDQQSQQYMALLDESPQLGTAPFTVFAPGNAAFDDVVRALFPDENVGLDSVPTQEMTAILNLHIVAHQALRQENFTDEQLNTLGGSVHLTPTDSTTVLIDPAGRTIEVEQGQAQATNGVIHSVGRVLLPEAPENP